MSFLNCVYLLALWCESAPRQLHINLVSSLYLFSSASLPWPNLWLSFPLLPIVTVAGSTLLWVLRPQTGARLCIQDELQSDAKSCRLLAGLELAQASPHLLTSSHTLHAALRAISTSKNQGSWSPSSSGEGTWTPGDDAGSTIF